MQMCGSETHAPRTLRGASIRSRRRLPRVGPVPEDGIAVGHHFGAGLLAKYTHPHHQAHEEDHFHLQHHYSRKTSRHVFLFNLGLRSADSQWIGLSGTLQVGRVTCLRHMWSCVVSGAVREKRHNIEGAERNARQCSSDGGTFGVDTC